MPGVRHPSWWGGRAHIVFTVIVFVVLASLDNAAIALVPAMILPTAEALDTSSRALGFMTGTVILVTAQHPDRASATTRTECCPVDM